MTLYKDARFMKLRNGNQGVRFASDEPIKLGEQIEIDIFQYDEVETVTVEPFWTINDGDEFVALAKIVR